MAVNINITSIALLALHFFFKDTATTEIYTLSLHDALPIFEEVNDPRVAKLAEDPGLALETMAQLRHVDIEAQALDGHDPTGPFVRGKQHIGHAARSEEHTSELQSQSNLVCRLLLEKKKTRI